MNTDVAAATNEAQEENQAARNLAGAHGDDCHDHRDRKEDVGGWEGPSGGASDAKANPAGF
jgi:hypothetical protein